MAAMLSIGLLRRDKNFFRESKFTHHPERDNKEIGIFFYSVKTVGIINPLEQTYIIIGHQEAEQFNYPGLRHKGQATFK